MGRVSLNGENVEFEGAPPQTCEEACSLVDGFLSGQGLAIDEVKVDGLVMSLEDAMARGEYQLLEITSIQPQLQLLAMCRSWKDETRALIAEMEKLGVSVLRRSWSESQEAVVAFLEKVRPVVEGIGVLQNFGSESGASWTAEVSSSFQGGIAGIDRVVNAVEAKDCAMLSDSLACDLAGGWGKVAQCLEEVVIPSLEKEFAS